MNEIVPGDMEFDMLQVLASVRDYKCIYMNLQVIDSLQLLEESPSSSALPDIAIVEKQLHSILGVLQSQATTAAATEENENALACFLPHSLVIVNRMVLYLTPHISSEFLLFTQDIILSCRKLRAQGQVDSAKGDIKATACTE